MNDHGRNAGCFFDVGRRGLSDGHHRPRSPDDFGRAWVRIPTLGAKRKKLRRLRLSEALSLQRGDVDLANSLLTLKKTKFARSRVVPLHPSTTHVLANYASVRDRAMPAPLQAEMFFLSAGGRKLNCRTVEY